MKYVGLIALALALTACTDRQEYFENSVKSKTRELIYTRDARTGICYSWAVQGYSHTLVPCSPEVLREIELQDR